MAAIVRVLWGEDVLDHRWTRVWGKDVLGCLGREDKTNYHVYVYGRGNRRRLVRRGVKNVHLINGNPFPKWEDRHLDCGVLMQPWRYKLELLRTAVEDHREIIYCDWDVWCRVKPHEAFRLLKGRQLTFSIYSYKRRRRLWERKPDVSDGLDRNRLCVSGNWMHMVGPEWLDKVLEAMPEVPGEDTAEWHDEWAMTRLLSRELGGWPGEEAWLRRYESPIMCQKHNRSPWPWTTITDKYVERATNVPFRWYRSFEQGVNSATRRRRKANEKPQQGAGPNPENALQRV